MVSDVFTRGSLLEEGLCVDEARLGCHEFNHACVVDNGLNLATLAHCAQEAQELAKVDRRSKVLSTCLLDNLVGNLSRSAILKSREMAKECCLRR